MDMDVAAPDMQRCSWSMKHEREILYHDTEWGVPRVDDAGQFEFLILESAQAGLSWSTILAKREGYRRAFHGFDPDMVARFTASDVNRLLQNPGIIRNRRKIEAAINNAKAFLTIAEEYGSFCTYIWQFVDGRPIVNAWRRGEDVPAVTPLAETIARELKRRGFSFLGPTVVYAHMQATGLVNDHLTSCFRYKELAARDNGVVL